MPTPAGKIRNPDTNRFVGVHTQLGKKLVKELWGCPPGQKFNRDTGRCVKENGPIGKKLPRSPKTPSPKSPKSPPLPPPILKPSKSPSPKPRTPSPKSPPKTSYKWAFPVERLTGTKDPLRKINDTVRKFYLYCSFASYKNYRYITILGPGPESDAVVYGSLNVTTWGSAGSAGSPVLTSDKFEFSMPYLIFAAAKTAFPKHTSVLKQKDKRSADSLLNEFMKRYPQEISGGASRTDLKRFRLPDDHNSFQNIQQTPYFMPDHLIFDDPSKGDVRLEFQKVLGKGAFGVVLSYATGTTRVALKIMRKTDDLTCFDTSRLTNDVDCDCILDQRCLVPKGLMKSIGNEWVVMEPANGDLGDILDILKKTSNAKRLSFTSRKIEPHMIVVAKCMVNICKSLTILDNNSKVYLDAKSANILYSYRPMGIHGMQEIVAKMGDLDGSCQNTSSSSKSSFAKSGSASYPPPDVWADKDFADVPCKRNFNSWSVAVMLLSLIGYDGLERLRWDVVDEVTPKKLAKYKEKALYKCRGYMDELMLMSRKDQGILKSLYSKKAADRPSLKVLLDIFTRYRDTLLDYVIDNSLL